VVFLESMQYADYYPRSGYLLSKKEGRVGSPEKPLSGLGEVAYKKYWQITVFGFLRDSPDQPTIEGG
jgi:hypothetical protein